MTGGGIFVVAILSGEDSVQELGDRQSLGDKGVTNTKRLSKTVSFNFFALGVDVKTIRSVCAVFQRVI